MEQPHNGERAKLIDKASAELEKASERRRSALTSFVSLLCKVPIEEGLERLGNDLSSTDREAK